MLGRDPHVPVVRRVRGEALERSVRPTCWSQTDVLGLARIPTVPRRHALRDLGDAGRFGEVAGELEERLRALGLTPLRLVQARVLERDGRVPGHHLEQPEVVGVELVESELRDDDDARHARPVA